MIGRPRAIAAAVIAATLLSGCVGQPPGPRLTVYAAASLTAAFAELGEAFAADHPQVDVLPMVFDGSSTLATQLVEGAPADVFASADLVTMTRVQDAGLLSGQPEVFATNTLQIAVAPGNPLAIHTLSDLADASLDVVLCGPEVPCGASAQELLQAAGVAVAAASEEQNVAAVATKVRLGEADAGLVYVTDIHDSGGELDGVEIPGADQFVNPYALGVLEPESEAATTFVDWVLSSEGQSILTKHGFGSP